MFDIDCCSLYNIYIPIERRKEKMSEYTPDKWVVVKLTTPTQGTIYKAIGGWSGGYLDGDSWRINSGVVKVTEDKNYYYFIGHSGSVYKCSKNSYGLTVSTANIVQQGQNHLKENFKLLPEDTNWLDIEYPE